MEDTKANFILVMAERLFHPIYKDIYLTSIKSAEGFNVMLFAETIEAGHNFLVDASLLMSFPSQAAAAGAQQLWDFLFRTIFGTVG